MVRKYGSENEEHFGMVVVVVDDVVDDVVADVVVVMVVFIVVVASALLWIMICQARQALQEDEIEAVETPSGTRYQVKTYAWEEGHKMAHSRKVTGTKDLHVDDDDLKYINDCFGTELSILDLQPIKKEDLPTP